MDVHDAPSNALKVHLLGQFLVYVCGRVLPERAIKGRKARSLLKLTALQRHGQIVRDRAMDALWPELDASAAASQLYKALHHIRKAFASEAEEAAEWVEMTDDLIRLAPPEGLVTDVQQFEQTARSGLNERRIADLEMAVSIYAGDLLPMDLYAEWTSLPREHYRQLYLDVLTTLAAQYKQRGALSEAAEMLRLALEKDPALESAHRALMHIFARQGQPTRALRQYDLCREALRSELGMGPSPETKETLEQVQERRWPKEPEPGAVRTTTPAPLPPLIGRTAECAALDRALDRLSAGEGSTLVISGEMGLGKTRLVQELTVRARRRDLRVFSGQAREEERAITYGPFVELFEAVLRERPELQAHLPEELGQLVPTFSGDGAPPIQHADKLAAQGYLFAQVQRFCARLGEEEAVVVVLEDLHVADESSRALFSYLNRHCASLPLLLVATTREDGTDLAPDADPAMHERAATVLELAPLTEAEHTRLLQQHADSPVSAEAADRIFRLSEGNPLFALELLQAQSDGDVFDASEESDGGSAPSSPAPIPSSLRRAVEGRLEELSPTAHHLLYIAAVIGRDVPYELLTSVWGGATRPEKKKLFDPLEEVTDARLLVERGLNYSFRHALMREAIYASISEARRRALHARIARRLVSMAVDAEDEPVEQIAHHFVRAGELLQGAHYLVRAGERAEAAYAHDDALRRYRKALAVLEDLDDSRARRLRCDVFERVGDVYRACGRLEQSYDAYENAVALAEELPLSGPNLVELHRKIALVAIFKTEMDRSEHHLTQAFERVDSDNRMRARLLIIKALHLWHLNRLEEAYDLAREALELAETVDASAEASQACEILAMTCLPLGRWEEGLEYEKRRQVHGWSPEIVVATDAHLCLWEYHITGDQPFEQARSFMQRVAEQADELGDLRCVAVCHYALGTMHLWRGEYRDAVDELKASLELHERVGSPAGMAYVRARQGVLHTMRGATERGWQAVQEGIANAQQAAVRDHCLQRLYGVGIWNRLEADDAANTQKLVRKSVELLDKMGACAACALELYPWLAYVHLRSGEMDRAEECGESVSKLAATTGNPIGEAVAAMIESSLLAADQNEKQARQRRREAFELIEEAITDAAHSPITHYLDRMADQQKQLQAA